MSDELQRHKHHGGDEHENEPDVEAHKWKHRTDDGETSDEADVEAHKWKHRTDDGDDDQPDVEAHRHRHL